MGATIIPAPKAYSVLLTIFVHLHHLAHHLISKTAPLTHACIYFFVAQPPCHRSSVVYRAGVSVIGLYSLSRPIVLALTNDSEEYGIELRHWPTNRFLYSLLLPYRAGRTKLII